MLTLKESQINGMENLRKIDNEIPDSNAISKTCQVISKKYTFQCLPMGLCNSPDIFQECMYEIFSDLEYVHVYIDNQLVTSCSTFEEHLQRLKLVFSQLSEAGLKINANKSHFAVSEIEYLG
jgi:hypothetical protein